MSAAEPHAASGMAAGSVTFISIPPPQHQMIIGNPTVLHFLPSNFKYNEILGLDTEGKGRSLSAAAVQA